MKFAILPFAKRFSRESLPWAFLALTGMALAFQFNPTWRGTLIYDRSLIDEGEVWRLWTGHFVHYGWAHFAADSGLFLILGCLLEPKFRTAMWISLGVVPVGISAALFWGEPELNRYAGLSALNLGLLLLYAGEGWQRNRRDWFWPAILAIYVGEVALEYSQGHGQGGGMIRFDDPTVQIATTAHVAGGFAGILLWLFLRKRPKETASRSAVGDGSFDTARESDSAKDIS